MVRSRFGTKTWPRHRKVMSVAAFPALRAKGYPLFPAAEPECCDLAPLPDQLEALPAFMQDSVKKGVQQAFRDMPPIVTARAPNEYPPFISFPMNRTVALISGGQDTSFPVQCLEDALKGNYSTQVSGAQYDIVTTVGFNNVTPQELFPFLTFLAGDYERAHVSGVDAIISSLDALEALAFTVMIDGTTVLDRVSLLDLAEVSIDAPPSSRITFYVANRDESSAFLVYFTVKGWQYPCQEQGNHFSSIVLREDGGWFEPNSACVPPAKRLKRSPFDACSLARGGFNPDSVNGA